MTRTGNYALITPARNEAATIAQTIAAVGSQSLRPARWIIVDDGSCDDTLAIVRGAIDLYPFITLVQRPDRGTDEVGAGVVEAFQTGLAVIGSSLADLEYIGKLDADIMISPIYFEQLCSHMDAQPKLGVASGQNYLPHPDGRLDKEAHARFHPVGGARLWRTTVFRDIGGLVASAGWDTLDLIRARRLGYETRLFDELKVIHMRPMGSRGELRDGVRRLGRISYLLGYHPLYFLLRALAYSVRRPFILRSFWLVSGYAAALQQREQLIVSPAERRWLRWHQLQRLLGVGDLVSRD